MQVKSFFFTDLRNHGLILPRIDTGRSRSVSRAASKSAPNRRAGGSYDPRDGPLTLELSHAGSKQSVQLPTETLDDSKKYYVTFTINKAVEEEEEAYEQAPARTRKEIGYKA